MSASRARSAASAILIGGVLAGVAFGAGGGTELGRTTVTEVALILLSAGVVAAAALFAPRGPLYGGATLVAFVAFVAVTAISVTWSISPELTYVEAGRALAYLGAFAAAVALARLAPAAGPLVLKGVLLAAVLVVAYSLAARVWPATLGETELSNRIGEPFGYWNAVGTTAAMAVPGALWLGARRAGGMAGRVLAYPALGLAIVAVLLTQSRGALGAALVGAALWFAIVPLRLRSLPVALIPAAAAAPVGAWALSKDAFALSLQPLSVKEAVAGEFGLLLALMVAVLSACGLVVSLGLARRAPSMRLRRRIGVAAVAAACLVPLAFLTSVAFSERGLSGTFSDRVSQLTADGAAPGEGAARFTAASNTRGKYWREAGEVFAAREGVGTGAGTFGVARLRFRSDDAISRHAHGFVPQTLADTGLLGLAASLALLATWMAAALRTTALVPRVPRLGLNARRRDWSPDRVTMLALGLVPVVFGLQSLIDWTWFVPGPAVAALVAAGFVAGRGPVTAPLVAAPSTEATPAPSTEAAPAPDAERPRMDETGEQPRMLGGRLPRPERGRILVAAGVAVCALLFAWAAWQPESSDRASDRALELADAGDFAAARAEARTAADQNPLTARPLLAEAAIETRAGRVDAAETALERAVLRFPGEPLTWLRLASFQLGTRDDPEAALNTVEGVLYLDPRSKPGRQLFLEARARQRAKAQGRAR